MAIPTANTTCSTTSTTTTSRTTTTTTRGCTASLWQLHSALLLQLVPPHPPCLLCRRLPLLSLLLLLATLTLLPPSASAAVTDQFPPFCGSLPSNPPPNGWRRWSSPATWPGGQVPGVGVNVGADATVPCDTAIILDISLTLNLLTINGWLKVEDAGPFQVMAAYVLNQGRLTIGTASSPYAGKITFNLTGSNSDLQITRPPASPSSPRSVGNRAFVTVGGQLELNGMYGNQPGWTVLAATAWAGATELRVKGDVSQWPVGGLLAIASTDFDRNQAENVSIVSVSRSSGGVTVLGISPALRFMHWGDPLPTGVSGVVMDEAAEVALLTRSITIQGHPNPIDPLIGGHFMVFTTATPQFISGLELVNMGQQGVVGRYPLHFHLCQDASASVVSSCVVRSSNQRCYVVHGTWNLRLDGNSGIYTKGHCFMLEDGIEYGNVFNRNLGFGQEPPSRILRPTDPIPATQSDGTPSTFWISNPNNTFTNNVAGGSFDSGWWFEVSDRVQGASALFPSSAGVYPKLIPLGLFSGNTAHSNGRAGLRTYPSGYRPRRNGGISANQETSGINAPPETIYITNFRAYKNNFIGMFIHETDTLVISGAMVADNAIVGIELNKDQGVVIKDSLILGETANVGNPMDCNVPSNTNARCKPLASASTCNLPVAPSQARSNSASVSRYWNMFGILIDQDEFPSHGTTGVPHRVENCTIALFNNKCRVAAGITANGHATDIWSAAHSSRALTIPDSSPALWFVPRNRGQLGFETSGGDAGVVSLFYVWRDLDGTVVGGSGGYAVANNTALLPSPASSCTKRADWNGYSCPGTCYRTIRISGGPFYLVKASDGSTLQTQGANFINVLANNAYIVMFTGASPPTSITFSYADFGFGCNLPVILQLPNPPTGSWQVAPSPSVVWQACQGVSDFSFGAVTQLQWVCAGGASSALQLAMGANMNTTASVVITRVAGSPVDCGVMQCGIMLAGSRWLSFELNKNLPGDFLLRRNPLPNSGWVSRLALLGFGGVGEATTISRPQVKALTWYFKKTFTLSSAGCYDSLVFGLIPDDAVAVYVNGKEAFRRNLPALPKKLTPDIAATVDVSATSPWVTVTIDTTAAPLVTGTNVISVELHARSATVSSVRFDMWLAAIGADCDAAQFYNQRSIVPAPPSSFRAKLLLV